jgi:hypothetical protein
MAIKKALQQQVAGQGLIYSTSKNLDMIPASPKNATGNTVPAINNSSTPCLCPQVPIT